MIVLRRARLRDLANLAALEQAAFPAPWKWYHLLAGLWPGGKIAVAEVGGRFAGFVLCLGRRLARLAVAPEYRRQGVGRALVKAVRRPGMTLQVRESNAAARTLYAGLGFGKVGECQYRNRERGEVWLWGGEGNATSVTSRARSDLGDAYYSSACRLDYASCPRRSPGGFLDSTLIPRFFEKIPHLWSSKWG